MWQRNEWMELEVCCLGKRLCLGNYGMGYMVLIETDEMDKWKDDIGGNSGSGR